MDILLIEDNVLIGQAICDHRAARGDCIHWCNSAVDGIDAATMTDYDCIILDLRLSDESGMTVLRQIRKKDLHVPILITSAFDHVRYRLEGISAGADDYLVKPFSLCELGVRITRLVERSTHHKS
ncbi:response regulator [Oryzifoliimicrobium ureilyticus]|uniref:response regulator n=1 Tax=Oryzifoliimicrobium ureilyticus TaxID=3113724 RepID=UPI003F67F00D